MNDEFVTVVPVPLLHRNVTPKRVKPTLGRVKQNVRTMHKRKEVGRGNEAKTETEHQSKSRRLIRVTTVTNITVPYR